MQARSLVNQQGARCKAVMTSRGDRYKQIIFLLTCRTPTGLKPMLCNEIKNILTVLLLVSYKASGFCVELSSYSEQYYMLCVFCLFLLQGNFSLHHQLMGDFQKLNSCFGHYP